MEAYILEEKITSYMYHEWPRHHPLETAVQAALDIDLI